MINLLPPADKKEILAARTNVLLLRYCIVSFACALLLFGAIIGVHYTLTTMKKTAQEKIDQSTQQTSQYSEVQKQVTEFTANLATAKKILAGNVQYSAIAIKIAQALPSGVVLENLTLDSTTFGKPTSLSAKARTTNDAVRLKNALSDSPYFDNVYLESVTRQADDNSRYPVSININVTMNGEAIKQ